MVAIVPNAKGRRRMRRAATEGQQRWPTRSYKRSPESTRTLGPWQRCRRLDERTIVRVQLREGGRPGEQRYWMFTAI